KENVASIILRILATGRVISADCWQLQEIGVPLSDSFMKLVPPGMVTGKELLYELTQLGYNSEKAMEPPVKEDGDVQPPPLPVIENKLEIYPNAVLIDGKQVRVRKD